MSVSPKQSRSSSKAVGRILKQMLVGFWFLYFALIALTNFVDLMGEAGVVDWTFLDSNNQDYLEEVIAVYDLGSGIATALLAGAFAIEAAAALLFARAFLTLRAGGGGREALVAIAWACGVWGAFLVAVEVFVAYSSASVFRELFMLTIATGIALVVIPDEAGSKA